MKIKKEDQVVIISGKHRGKKGKVIRTLPQEDKVAVEGVNLVKKSIRSKRSGEKGQIVEMPSPLHVSNVKLICPNCDKATKIGFKITESKKQRFCKKCNKEI